MDKTKIDWCDSTWNPVTGCLHGCEYCYARDISEIRFKGRKGYEINEDNVRFVFSFGGSPTLYELDKPCYYDKIEELERIKTDIKAPYPYGFMPTFHRYRLNDYIGKKGRNIFVCSMADLFGDWVPDSWIEEVFKACEKASQHNYLFLTKNPRRFVKLQDSGKIIQQDNMWYGASVTDEKSLKVAANAFGNIKTSVKTFFSIEPILENIIATETWDDCVISQYMDWVIIGAETGRRKEKVVPDKAWIRSIVFDCDENWSKIPIFMKSSIANIWGKPLIQEFPKELKGRNAK